MKTLVLESLNLVNFFVRSNLILNAYYVWIIASTFDDSLRQKVGIIAPIT